MQQESTQCWKLPLMTVANTALIQLCENNLDWDPMKDFQNQTFKLWTWSNKFKLGTFLVNLVTVLPYNWKKDFQSQTVESFNKDGKKTSKLFKTLQYLKIC